MAWWTTASKDAPALAKATVGFAMGAAGTDTTIETADVALMEDDLRKLPLFLRLSRQTSRALAQNITLAIMRGENRDAAALVLAVEQAGLRAQAAR